MPVGAIAIEPVQNLGGAVSFAVRSEIEAATQTFFEGTPVNIRASDGGVIAWAGTGGGVTGVLAGFAAENASNLATTGAGAPQGFTPVLGPGSTIGSYPANPNQPAAVVTPPGVPMSFGRTRLWVPAPGTVFVGKLGNAGNPAATALTQVGQSYGLTIDTNNYWYVDLSKTTGGTNTCVTIVQLDPRDIVGTVGGRVWFTVIPTAAQLTS